MRKRICCLFVVLCANYFVADRIWSADRQVTAKSVSRTKPASESVEVRDFEVRVDNKPVGTHRLKIESDKDVEKVEIQTDVKVDVVVYAYVFKFRGTETWRAGRLDDYEMRCEDGGKKRAFSLKTDGSTQQLSLNGKSLPDASHIVMTTSYWKLPPANLRDKALRIVDVDQGAARDATWSLIGTDPVPSGSQSLKCQHFKIDGPSPAELWFDDQDRLVRQKSLEQGHWTELRLKQIKIVKDES